MDEEEVEIIFDENLNLPDTTIELLTQNEMKIMSTYLRNHWNNYADIYLSEIDKMNIEISISTVTGVLWQAFNALKLALCGVSLYKVKECSKRDLIRTVTKEIKILLEYSSKIHKFGEPIIVDQKIVNVCGVFFSRITEYPDEQKNQILECQISKPASEFLNVLEEMIKSLCYHIRFSAPEELERQKYLFSKWDADRNFRKQIQNINLEIEKLRDKTNKESEQKQKLIDQIILEIKDINLKCRDSIYRAKVFAAQSMVKANQQFTETKTDLQKRLVLSEEEYDACLKKDMKSYKKLTEIKYKKQSNLLTWISKYDSEAAQRSDILEELQDEEKALTKTFNEIKQKTLIQDESWKVYIESKREDTRQKIYLRTRNRAASKIQRWFKKCKKRILKKRKKQAKLMKKKNQRR